MTWGKMIMKNVSNFEYPNIYAASYWPLGIDSIPPL